MNFLLILYTESEASVKSGIPTPIHGALIDEIMTEIMDIACTDDNLYLLTAQNGIFQFKGKEKGGADNDEFIQEINHFDGYQCGEIKELVSNYQYSVASTSSGFLFFWKANISDFASVSFVPSFYFHEIYRINASVGSDFIFLHSPPSNYFIHNQISAALLALTEQVCKSTSFILLCKNPNFFYAFIPLVK